MILTNKRGGNMYNFYAAIIKNGSLSGHNTMENEDFIFNLSENDGHIKGTVTALTDFTFCSI